MKKIIAFIALIVTLASCSDLLEEKSFSSLTVESFFNNYDEANQTVIGAYSLLTATQYYKRGLLNIVGFTSDDSYHNGALFTVFDDGDLDSNNSLVENLWDVIFNLNGRTNFTVFAMEQTDKLSEEEKTLLLGRVRFLRALNLYNAVRLWGDIPLIKEYSASDENTYPARSPKADVYAFIEEDLMYCVSTLPVIETEYGFPTKGAAFGLLGKVYMSQEKWTDANSAIDSVIGLGMYDILDNYMDVFDVNNENNVEELFSIQFKNDDAYAGENSLGSLLPFWFIPKLADLGMVGDPNQTAGQMRVEHATYDRYSTGDYTNDGRNQIFITSYPNLNTGKTIKRYPENTTAAAQGPACGKYQDPTNSNERNYNNNLYILRYADILLMKAEVENELHGATGIAYEYFNKVRLRSNTIELTPGLSKEGFRDAIADERGLEFFGEFQRWFDQTRMKRNGESYYKYTKEKVVSEGKFTHPAQARWALAYYPKYELMPIPGKEIANNPNINIDNQNPNYQ
ncbi:MAG: RagB/SusD family nutrient uptake outer membrane protein [Bacteroidales bacterium]